MRGEGVDNTTKIDINNISMFVTNTGSFALDKPDNFVAGLEFPKGTGKTAVYAAGMWLGARVSGQTRVAVSEYSDEYGPGAILNPTTWDNPDKTEYKVYKLYRNYTDTATRDAALADYNAGAVIHGAPPVTVQSDGTLNILGDEMMWSVYNDLDPSLHTNEAGRTLPLGIEIQQTTFAFSRQGALGNTIFVKYRIINKGANQLDSMYVSQWSDPDLGGATDDLVGCDVGRSLGFVYNATNSDAIYGAQPPSVGYRFFQGPKVGGTPLPLASFNKYINGTDPNNFSKSYNYMRGLDADGNVVINPVTSSPTTFVVDGDPVAGTGWLDSNPADRRLMLSAGPFSMAPNDTQEVVIGIVIGQSANRLASIALMRFYADLALSAFQQNFNLAAPPQPPIVRATPQDGAVLLTWDTSAENYSQPPYKFEGYTVYQGASVAGPFTRVATFDLNDGITTVLDPAFDEQSFVVLPKVSAQGNDGGLQYQIRLTGDAVRGGPLFNGTPYYFTVDAYAVGLGLVPQVLESAFNPITVVPQTPPGDVNLNSASVTSGPTFGQYVSGLVPTTDSVKVYIKDRDQMIAADYKVGYKPDATGIPLWYLVRTTASGTDTLVNNSSNFSGDDSYPIVDGIQVKVIGAPYRTLLRADYVDVGPNPPGLRPDPGIGAPFWNPDGTGGGVDYAANNFGSSLDPSDISKFNNVEIRFTGGAAGQKAYRYLRCNCSPRTYLFQNYVDVPFTVWDVDNNRQLNVGFLENYPTADGMWDPDTIPDFGATGDDREFIQVYSSTYSSTAQTVYTTTYPDWLADAGSLDLMYYLWPNGTTTPLTIDAGDKFEFVLATRSANDYFAFSTRGANRSDASLAKQEMSRIKAVPNPYFAHSAYELNQFGRVVKFTHLPQRCTIRLFTLTGEQVRVLEKNDATSQATWDLLTSNGLPVGSGIYVFHVDAPGIGTHIGKMAVFVEKERLNNY
jgi:hypothetical protein